MSLLHPDSHRLALYAGGDLGFAARWRVRRHVESCPACRRTVESLNACRQALGGLAEELPPELAAGDRWDRLAAEMTANIRLGLAAGECVGAPPAQPRVFTWQMAALAVGLMFVMAAAWVINVPNLPKTHGTRPLALGPVHYGPEDPLGGNSVVLEATPAGVQLRENGRALTLVHGQRPEQATYVSSPDSLRVRYVNADSGQVTINTVYVQ